MDGERKAFRLIGGILVERTVADVLPDVTHNHENVSAFPTRCATLAIVTVNLTAHNATFENNWCWSFLFRRTGQEDGGHAHRSACRDREDCERMAEEVPDPHATGAGTAAGCLGWWFHRSLGISSKKQCAAHYWKINEGVWTN